ncbi:MAG: ribosome biogenesis GTP-binding protein YihA/YsxC [Gammaproteobacteria bacterium]|nr:ribosome biogenesis GTP-binding protein YihA/YsxC [Gammaproteobacteria bacterium]
MRRDSPLPSILREPQFVVSAHLPKQWVVDSVAEVAFAGRSNVGKSSAINAITQRRGLARTSKIPGRTQQIVFFRLRPGHYLVDLPGYGYARVPQALQEHWRHTIEAYLSTRSALKGLVLLMDARRPLTPLDNQMLTWSAAATLPTYVLLTKADKLGRGAMADTLRRVRNTVADYSADVVVHPFSAVQRAGVEEARAQIVLWLEQ